jgi:hypothetical protein
LSEQPSHGVFDLLRIRRKDPWACYQHHIPSGFDLGVEVPRGLPKKPFGAVAGHCFS